ncbi:tetratricopeptide repeat protein [Microvirga sp. KLBC 81]|uniref:tetratricopeptide repeat protein n=1 Tax=Microvirga sp. KLBC 81 TaxID=1862707 RepID=UPI001402E153|nr:tetratricopeptide repeat protein [Microvirga sp. KLBC 81]
MTKGFWLSTLLTATALLALGPAWPQTAPDTQMHHGFRASMEQIERLRQRQDQEAFVEQAKILQSGLPISETNPLRKAQPDEAERLLERALANPGPHWASAAVRRAKMLLNRDKGRASSERAAELLRRAAAMQNREAAYLLAGLMETGTGVPQDIAAAKGLYQVALRLGHGPAGLALARLESDATKVNVFASQGLRLLFQDARQGSADAARTLADHYRATSDSEPDRLGVALEWYRRASDLGDPEASLRLGRMRLDSKTALYQPQEARSAFEKAANGGLVEAALALAEDSYKGGALGVPSNEGELWLNRALETKEARALLLGAEIYSQQGSEGREKAKMLLTEALQNVDDDPGVLVGLGRELRNGDLIERDLPLAITLFDRAAMQDNTTASYEYARTVLSYPDATTEPMRKTAIARLQAAAEFGHVKAAISLGDALLNGNGVAPSASEAVRWYEKAAAGGATMALIRLGDYYALHSDGVEISRALEWYRKAADANISTAMIRLGRMYNEGRGVPQDYALAATWFSRAAAAGSGPAMMELSALYSRAGGPGHFNLARDVLETAVRAGDMRASIALAKLYLARGERALAETALRKIADAGDTEAALQLAELYLSGGADQIHQARRWLSAAEKAASGNDRMMVRIALLQMKDLVTAQHGATILESLARKNNTEAMTSFAQALMEGVGIQPDANRAEALLQRAIQLGNDNARFVLAKAYREGNGIEKNPARAVALYREIYNDEPGDTKVLLALGDAYVRGEGVTRDRALATQFYALAAQNGDPEGKMHLGMAYLYGGGVPHDGAKAERLLAQAGDANLVMARLQLGDAKASGMGAAIDPEGAFASYLRTAESGSPEAMIEVARALKKGFGTQRDPALALSWLERAARMGSQGAMYELYRMNALATDAKPQEAERWLLQAAQNGHPAAMYHLALRYRPPSPDQNSIDGNEWLAKAAQAGHWQAIKAIRKKKLPEPGESDDDE